MPALKRIMIGVELPGTLKRSYPRMNAGASTKKTLPKEEDLGLDENYFACLGNDLAR